MQYNLVYRLAAVNSPVNVVSPLLIVKSSAVIVQAESSGASLSVGAFGDGGGVRFSGGGVLFSDVCSGT